MEWINAFGNLEGITRRWNSNVCLSFIFGSVLMRGDARARAGLAFTVELKMKGSSFAVQHFHVKFSCLTHELNGTVVFEHETAPGMSVSFQTSSFIPTGEVD